MEEQPNPHHLVLGKLKCFLTSAVLTDTLDDRYRQNRGLKIKGQTLSLLYQKKI